MYLQKPIDGSRLGRVEAKRDVPEIWEFGMPDGWPIGNHSRHRAQVTLGFYG